MKKAKDGKTLFLPVIFLILLIIQGCSSSAPLCQSRWQDKPVTIDGRLTEWPVPLDFVDKDTKLNYVISNDDSNLYYWIRITDDKEQVRILRAGMQFWIDTTGKNKQQVGIEFPFSALSVSDSSFKGSKKWTGKLDQMRLIGFHQPIAGITPTKNNYGIKACIGDTGGVTIYEACIPFRTFYKSYLTSADDNKQLGITMIINPMPETGHQSHSNHGGGGGAGGGGFGGPGGMYNGGMGGNGMHGGGGNRNSYGGNAEEDQYHLESAKLKMALRLTVK